MSATHVGLVGCGHWGQNLLRDLKLLGAQVSVVARSEESRARADRHGADAIVGDLARMPRVDAVYIATTVGTHADVIDAVLDRGVPIFCEKPLCDDVARADDLAERGAARLFVLDKWRYHPGVVEIARIAKSGELGPVIGLSTRRLGWGSAHSDASAIWVLGPHDLAIGLEILGRVPPLRAAVVDGIDGVGGAHGVMSGAAALMADESAWLSIEISERSPDRIRSIQLLCREGGVTLSDTSADHVSVYRIAVGETSRRYEVERRRISEEWPLKIMLAETLRFLSGGPPPKTPARDGAIVVRRLSEIVEGASGHWHR